MQDIANYLKENDMAVTPILILVNETTELSVGKYFNGIFLDLVTIIYESGEVNLNPFQERVSLISPLYMSKVFRPIERKLKELNGDYMSKTFKDIHKASEKVHLEHMS